MTKTTPQQIAHLEVRNFMRLTHATIDFHGTTPVVVAGDNAQGKSSLIRALTWGLSGSRKEAPAYPLKRGETEGEVRVTLTDGSEVLWRFKLDPADPTKAQLLDPRIRNAEGGTETTTTWQKALGAISWTPGGFLKLEKAKQLQEVLQLVDLPFDLAEMQQQIKNAESRRTDAGREKDRTAKVAAALPVFPDAPAHVIDTAVVQAEIDALLLLEEQHAAWVREKARLDAEREEVRSEIARLTLKLERLDAETLCHNEHEPSGIDVDHLETLRGQIRNATDINQQVLAQQLHQTAVAAAAEARLAWEAEEATVQALREEVTEGLACAVMPVPGLSFGEGELLLNGLPLDQASAAERQRLCLEMDLVKAQAQQLRLMVIDDAEKFTPANLALVMQRAEAAGFQTVWAVARTDYDGPGEVIEVRDGIAASAPVPA